jgi:hypothetical protein
MENKYSNAAFNMIEIQSIMNYFFQLVNMKILGRLYFHVAFGNYFTGSQRVSPIEKRSQNPFFLQ